MNLHDELGRLASGERRDLGVLTPAQMGLLDDLLGSGDVVLSLGDAVEIRESMFPGIWRMRMVTAEGAWHAIEAAEVPAVVDRHARAALRPRIAPQPAAAAVLSAPQVLQEIEASLAAGAARVISLTNLPVSADDMDHLEASLGHGAIHGEAAGYGVCRFAATAVHRVWRVRYFNADDRLLVDSLEVADLPLAARAQPEDLADGLAGLARLLAIMTPGGADA